MTLQLSAYTPDGTLLGALAPSRAEYTHRQAEDGTATAVVNGDIAAALLDEAVVVRINDGTADRFAFLPHTKTRQQVEAGTEVTLSGPGVRYLLTAAQVYPEDTTDCALPADSRWFGWMSGAYDDTGWTAPVTHGSWRSQPFPTARPENWPAPMAQFLWRSTDYDLGEEDVLFRQTFTLSDDQDVVLCISADDEYECWLDGTKLPIGTYGGNTPFRWEDYDQYPVKLCAGAHTFAVRGRNLERPTTNQNPAWVIWAFTETAGDGKPAAANQTYTLTTDATGGTFTVGPDISGSVATIDYNESAADFQTALEAIVGEGNVSVSGGAGDWDIEFHGALASMSIGLHIDSSGLTGGTVTQEETQRGDAAQMIAWSDVLDVVHYDPAAGEPGMTPGEILHTCLEEARTRGVSVLDDVAEGFTTALASDGNPWAFELNLPVPLPSTVHRVAVLLEEQGLDVWMDPDLTLQCSDEQGVDGTATATFTPGTDQVTDVVARQEESTVRNVVRLRTTKGWTDAADTDSVTARGRWESGVVLEGFETALAAQGHTNLLLNDLATPQRHTTLTVPSEGDLVPYVDFGLGDRVIGPAFGVSGWDQVAMRVVSISGQTDEASVVWSVELVD